MNKYSQFFSIMKRNRLEKDEVIREFTKGRTSSLNDLSDGEYREMMNRLARHNKVPPGDQQRKKMIRIAGNMNWGNNAKQIVAALDKWLLKQKYKKPLMDHSFDELNTMVAVLEEKVWPTYQEKLKHDKQV